MLCAGRRPTNPIAKFLWQVVVSAGCRSWWGGRRSSRPPGTEEKWDDALPAGRTRPRRAGRVRQLRLKGGDGGGVRRDRRLQRQAARWWLLGLRGWACAGVDGDRRRRPGRDA